MKFKNSKDWSSIFTVQERKERELNMAIMKTRFGDESLAFKTVSAQDKYKS